MKRSLIAGAGVIWMLTAAGVVADCPPCGPDYCLTDTRYPPLLAAKKTRMKDAGYPADLVALMDRDGACVARIAQAPDGFTILSVTSNGNSTVPWDARGEEIARTQLLNGETVAYYKFNVRRAFRCCNQPRPEDRADWDAELTLSKGLAIKCTRRNGAVACQ